jgi:hypothetical protein
VRAKGSIPLPRTLPFVWLAFLAGACIAGAPAGVHRVTDEGTGGEAPIEVDASTPDAKDDLDDLDPHAVLGTEPPHGPFLGGQSSIVHGKGFTETVRVWFGDAEIDPQSLTFVDDTRVLVTVPGGDAGPVDVSAQNGDDESTKRTLVAGYVYDAAYAVPDTGPVAGGNVVEIVGQGTHWDSSTVVTIDQKPCVSLTVDSPTSLACTVPEGTPGAKPLRVTTGDEVLTALDAYTYEDSDNGYAGGLSGAPLAGQLKVLVYNNFTGEPIGDAHAIAGTNIATALIEETNASGVAILSDPSLTVPTTVTVAARCHSPVSFVDVPVDTVTVYLDPVITPICGSSGDLPLVGGKPQHTGTIMGELVWDGGVEFQKAPWKNVPSPIGETERQAAYVFVAGNDPAQFFTLPAQEEAVTPDAPGDFGYSFALSTLAGNRALYAIAGVEDRTVYPVKFTAYAMGVARGVPVLPNEITENVYLYMRSTLDQAITMDVTAPPPGPKGPDRVKATVALMLGNDGYAILPAGQKVPFLPLAQDLPFIGVPELSGELFGSSYLSSARAVTGPSYQAPLSVIARVLTTSAGQIVPMTDFLGVPTLAAPAVNGPWDGRHLATSFPEPGPPVDVTVYDVVAGNGFMHWLVAVPGGSHSIELPDISGYELAALPSGPLVMTVIGGRIDGFDYGALRYRHLRTSGMSAYSLDYFNAHL